MQSLASYLLMQKTFRSHSHAHSDLVAPPGQSKPILNLDLLGYLGILILVRSINRQFLLFDNKVNGILY